jgi:hypothetical protein
MPIVNEVEMKYRTPLLNDLEKYRGNGYWVHFSTTEKLGINTQSQHGDPVGIYFYNLDWLLNHPRFNDGQQYATARNYWTVVQLHENPKGINLGTVTRDQLSAIIPDVQDSKEFWSRLTKSPNKNSLLKSIPYVIDPNLGIVHWNEPYQLIVRDVRSIKIIARGEQYRARTKKDRAYTTLGEIERDENVLMHILTAMRGRYGGKIVWENKTPILKFHNNGATFILNKSSGWSSYITLKAQWGNAEHTTSQGWEKAISSIDFNTLIDFFSKTVDQISEYSKRGKELFFKPILTKNEAKARLKEVTKAPFETSVRIENQFGIMQVIHQREYFEEGNTLLSGVNASIKKDGVHYYAYVKVNGFHLVSVDTENFEGFSDNIMSDFTQRCNDFSKHHNQYMRYFYYDEDFLAFKGWVAQHSCIRDLSNSEEDEKYRHADKEMLMREIKRVL